MSRIKVRNPAGSEHSFQSREEFVLDIVRGKITADWEIFHTTRSRWLPVRVHPAFQAVANSVKKPE